MQLFLFILLILMPVSAMAKQTLATTDITDERHLLELLDSYIEKRDVYAKQKEEKLKQEFKNLRLYYLYDKDSKAVGDMSYSARIFKGDKPKRYKVTRDWKTYETYMGKYFPIIGSMKDEIEDKFIRYLFPLNQ